MRKAKWSMMLGGFLALVQICAYYMSSALDDKTKPKYNDDAVEPYQKWDMEREAQVDGYYIYDNGSE